MQIRQPENLFRQNAIDSLVTKFDGRPVAVMPRPWLWLTTFCAAFSIGAVCFLWSADYARKETVRGWLVSEPGVVSLSYSDFATVTRVEHAAGDTVRRGDPVVLLSNEVTLGGGARPAMEALKQLRAQLDGTDRREELLREQFVSDYRAIEDQARGLGKELREVDNQRREQDGRVRRNAETQKRLQAAFESGAIAKLELQRRMDELAAMYQSVARLRQEKTSLQRERQGLIAARERLGTEFERNITNLEAERSELLQRIAQYERQRSFVLQSPIDGTVATLDVVPGSTVRPQQLLATIIPRQSSLVADVFVPSRAVGMIKPGQAVRLLYDAFPHQQFGTASGEVDAVAGFVSLPGDIPFASGLREAAYKVTISISADHVEDNEGRYALRPGMALAAEIVLESRKLADWLLAPLQARL
ncbi:MAG: HlyD family secretion protein [Gammaproteobacteria bacterium]|nr:HlyD family secretion protein [Gammaproteobacteria bacterium]